MSLCKTLPLFIIKQIYHFSLYLVKYPQTPTDLECQVKDLTYRVNDLEETLYRKGLYYKNKFKKSYEEDLYEAIIDWEKMRKGESLNYTRTNRILSYMGPRNLQKEKIYAMVKDKFYNIESYDFIS